MADSPAAAAGDLVTVEIISEGRAIPDEYLVMGITTLARINDFPEAVIVFKDGDAAQQTFDVADDSRFAPGAKIEIRAGYHARNRTIFAGVVVATRLCLSDTGSRLEVRCRDVCATLADTRHAERDSGQSDDEVITALVDAAGGRIQIGDMPAQEPVIVPGAETDWAFIRRLLDRNGQVASIFAGQIAVAQPSLTAPVLTVTFGTDLNEIDLHKSVAAPGLDLSLGHGSVTFPGNAMARPGMTLQLLGLGQQFSGNGYVSGVDHWIGEGSWTTTTHLGLDGCGEAGGG
jgi:phage protein D